MRKKIFWFILCIVVSVGMYGVLKPLPNGVNFSGEEYKVSSSDVHFLSDKTYVDEFGQRHSGQEIFDEVFRMIDEANSYIVLDFFLYNDFVGTATSSYRQISEELTAALLQKKQDSPSVKIQMITDPINEFYGGIESRQFLKLQESGINIITTDLNSLRDSNFLYSSFWRAFVQWFGGDSSGGILPNPLSGDNQKTTLRSYLSSLNFKANHRKLILADYTKNGERGLSVLVTSANPHDGSSAHSNVAVRVDKLIWKDVLETEKAVADFSGASFVTPPTEIIPRDTEYGGDVTVQLLTEGSIRRELINSIEGLTEGDSLDMAMFYIADRGVIRTIKEAYSRGVNIRMLLDPNKDAFGREKNGMPNRQVANELNKYSNGEIKIKWCHTHGEQCHSKLVLLSFRDKRKMFIGSANLTRRNIGNFNLETNILISGGGNVKAISDAQEFFEERWSNTGGKIFSTNYDEYKDESVTKQIRYRVQEFLGTNRW